MVLCLLNDFGCSLNMSSVCAVGGSVQGICVIMLYQNHDICEIFVGILEFLFDAYRFFCTGSSTDMCRDAS